MNNQIDISSWMAGGIRYFHPEGWWHCYFRYGPDQLDYTSIRIIQHKYVFELHTWSGIPTSYDDPFTSASELLAYVPNNKEAFQRGVVILVLQQRLIRVKLGTK